LTAPALPPEVESHVVAVDALLDAVRKFVKKDTPTGLMRLNDAMVAARDSTAALRTAMRAATAGSGAASPAAGASARALGGDGEPVAADRPEVVCLCGSTRFIDTFQEQYGRLTDEGKIVLTVGRVVPQSEQALGSQRKVALDTLHLRKIDLADRVLVLNVGGYVGPSTRREIEYARAHGKPIDLLHPDAGLDGPPPAATGDTGEGGA